jgi:transcriptional regulator with XRE-family HTH domain
MTGADLRSGREQKGWTQKEASLRLGVSQPYLSLLEKGDRSVPRALARTAAHMYGLSPSALPVERPWERLTSPDEDTLAHELAALGYPGFAYLKRRHKRNPAEVLVSALNTPNLESRLTEALPWIVLQYPDLDWHWLARTAKLHDLQNRLGFVTSVARRLARTRGETERAAFLEQQEALLEPSRLAREDTLCHESLSQAERRWLRNNRPREARHWNLLTDLAPEHLSHAA